MSESKGLSFRFDPVLSLRLQKLAESTNRSASSIISEAVQQYLALNEWHLQASVKSALAHARHGKPAGKIELQPLEDLPIAG